MNHHNEIIAMRSAGLSVFQITQTIIIIGTMMSLLVFWVNEKFLPQSLSLTERIKTQMESGSSKIQGRDNQTIENLSMYGLKNRLFFINKFFAATKTMDGIIILEHDRNQNVTKKIMANKGVYRNGLWRFYNSITFNFDQNGQIKQEPQYSNEEIMIIPETPDDFLRQRQRPDFMTMSELDEYIWKLSNSGATTVIRNLKIDLYKRFVSPFTSLIIVLLVIPFSLKTRGRAAGLSSIGLSVTVGFLYYVLDAVCIALGKGGILPPILSVSASHIIALVTALGLIKDLP
jgi:lipopolysaccharide export system permease protein